MTIARKLYPVQISIRYQNSDHVALSEARDKIHRHFFMFVFFFCEENRLLITLAEFCELKFEIVRF
jgi:hypothetical protein